MAPHVTMTVGRPGTLTLVQDLGRTGYQAEGISPGGAADPFAARVANLLVGNAPGAAVLELTLVGPDLEFSHDTLVALTGSAFRAAHGGADLPRGRPVRVPAGSALALGKVEGGARGWLAVAGGIEAPVQLGSRSTDLRARFGGCAGRALASGDRLAVGEPSRWASQILQHLSQNHQVAVGWRTALACELNRPVVRDLRCLRGPEFSTLPPRTQRALFRTEFTVDKESDRMGIRLRGPGFQNPASASMISAGVATGVVQLPPDGQPIVLFCDRQTIGGYPRVACVISADHSGLAQLRPGDRVRFREVSLNQALELHRARELDLNRFGVGVARLGG